MAAVLEQQYKLCMASMGGAAIMTPIASSGTPVRNPNLDAPYLLGLPYKVRGLRAQGDRDPISSPLNEREETWSWMVPILLINILFTLT